MNWLNFLNSKAGKLVVGVPQLVGIAGVGMVAAYTAFHADKTAVEEGRVRSLSSISTAYDYSHMRQSGRSGLTSINVKDGLNQLATEQERARMEAARTGNGNFGLDAADNLGNSVAGSLGAAAETSDTEGFGMGRNAVTMQENTSKAVAADAAHVNPAALQRASSEGGTQLSQLAPASMSHASGSGVNSSYGGGSSTGMSSGATGASGKTEGYQLSGRMPGGNNIVALNSAAGRGPSSFQAGGRDATVGKGSHSNGGNDLKDISKRSAEVARNRNRAANEGSAAFLASSQNSGGMTFDNGMETTETGSADFSAPEARRLKAIGDWGKKEDDRAKRQQKRMTTLFSVLMGLIAATVALVPVIKALKQIGKTPYLGIAANAWAFILAGVLATAWGLCMAQAVLYGKDYFWPNNDWSWLAFGALLVGGISIGVIAAVVFGAKAVKGEEALSKAKEALAFGAKDIVGQAVSVGGNLGQTALQESEMNAINRQNHK